jgi:uncharacterized protein YndB with AHSA1/START domain
MITVERSVLINKSVADVFAYVSNGDNTTKWQIGVEAVQQGEGTPNTVGSRFTEVRKFMGQEMKTTLELTTFEPNAKWAAKVIKGPVPYEITSTFEAANGGTKMTMRLEGEPSGFFKVAQGMVSSQLEKNLEESGQKLKELLETS